MRIPKVLVMVAVLALVASWAQAATGPTVVIIDESGNGTLGVNSIPWTIGQDTGPGGLPNALIYQLPSFFTNWTVGDLLLQEPAGTGGGSDLIRFNPDGTLVFYSDTEPPENGEPADIGLPELRYANNLTRTELGDEGANGILYVPTEGSNPGFVLSLQMEYQITSDVPEPATLSLLVLGGLALIRRGRK